MNAPWTVKEEKQLLYEVSQPYATVTWIAETHKRSENHILARLQVIAFEMIMRHHLSVDEVVKQVRFVNKKTIEAYANKRDVYDEQDNHDHHKKDNDSETQEFYKVLWKFKLFLKTKYKFDKTFHEEFDEFVQLYTSNNVI